ncbi:HalOD1 output domain-containing protein [Halorussus sp. AFM4]|uniref:HalOD1 output domain-containing protein n=1 Tax=Halorussus sp. AFM4 TaxID=3421651 RepID=UPI003EB7C357
MHDSESPATTAAEPGNQPSGVSRTFYDPEGDASLVQTILEALDDAAAPGEEPTVRLYDAVDPDALEAIFRPTRNGPRRDAGRVSFTVGAFAVDVYADGQVVVRRTA